MGKLLNMDIGSLFGKKEDEDTKVIMDNENSGLVEKAIVHTMNDDLNPEKKSPIAVTTQTENNLPKPEKTLPKAPAPESIGSPFNLPKAELKSTFFQNKNQKEAPHDIPTPQYSSSPQKENVINIVTPSPLKINNYPINQPSPAPKSSATFLDESPVITQKSSSTKIFAIILSLFVILALAGGGYYFWTLQQKPAEIIFAPEEIIPPVETVTPEVPAKPKPRYMNFDLQNSSALQMIETLKKYVNEVKASGETKPVEFLVTDMQNNPLTFSVFSQKIGLVFPPNITTNLSDNFTLFIYNDTVNTTLGLAIDIKDEAAAKTAISASEKYLVKSMDPLLLNKPAGEIDENKIFFQDNNYKQMSLRYYNIISRRELSVDYAITGGKLLVGTTMMTLREIFDYFEAEKNSTNSGLNSSPVYP